MRGEPDSLAELACRILAGKSRGLIIIVNAVSGMRLPYAAALLTAGYDVIELDDAAALVGLVVAQRPRAVLIDISVAAAEGIAACQRLKATPSTAGTYTIMIGSRRSFAALPTAILVSTDEFVLKPFTLRNLVERIERYGTDEPSCAVPMTT